MDKVSLLSFSIVQLLIVLSVSLDTFPNLTFNKDNSVFFFSSSFPSFLPSVRPSLLNYSAILSIPSHISISSPSGKSLIKSKLPVIIAA